MRNDEASWEKLPCIGNCANCDDGRGEFEGVGYCLENGFFIAAGDTPDSLGCLDFGWRA